jgi:hypothetical protein
MEPQQGQHRVTRERQYELICAMAGMYPDGSIMPPGTLVEIDRSELTWWTNHMPSQKTIDRFDEQREAERQAGKAPELAHSYGGEEVPPKRLLDTDSDLRKLMPMCSGLLDYFPDALASVSNISHRGNEKHNPGQPLHWARGKSMDHADCIARHLTERGGFDQDGNRHSAQLAWRALALLQEELERDLSLSKPRGAR